MGGDTGSDRYQLSVDLEGRLGVPPLICTNGKAALHKRWQADPFVKPDMVRNRLRHHQGNVGAVMGRGLVGVDLDLYKPEGAETHRMLGELGWLPASTSQRTQSGGLHLLYRFDTDRWDIGCGDFAKITGPDGTPFPGGAEWKGTGGYLVVYGWDDTPIAGIHPDLAQVIGTPRREAQDIGAAELHPKTLEATVLLEEHFGGHHRVSADDGGRRYLKLTRPGKDAADGTSCTVGQLGDGTTKIWSKGWPPFAYEQVVDLWELRRMAGVDSRKITVPSQLAPFTTARHIRSERQVWLWNDHLPAGQLVMAAGYEKLGKSTALIWIGARLTRGDLPGDFEGRPLNVCFVSAEDDAAHILKPRAVAAGADLDRFYLLNPDPQAEGFSLAALRELRPALIVLDPWSVFIHLKTSSSEHGEVAVRQALQPFAELAADGMTVCGIRHLRKSSPADNPYDAVLGSRAWSAAVRALLFFTPDPAHRDQPYGLMFPRGNLSRPTPGSCYQLQSTPVALDDGTGADVPVFTLAGGTTITLDEALGPRQASSAREEAEKFLSDLLDAGRVDYEVILQKAKEKNISLKTLRRVKKDLGVVSDYEGAGKDRVTYWRLTDEEDGQDGQDGQE